MSEKTAAQHYFDPPDPIAYCDDCGGRLDDNDEHLDEDEHQRWEEEQVDEEPDAPGGEDPVYRSRMEDAGRGRLLG